MNDLAREKELIIDKTLALNIDILSDYVIVLFAVITT